jgi:hypothetical protein
MQEAMAAKVTRCVMAAQMAKTARSLHGEFASPESEYTRGQVELICYAAGLSPNEYLGDVGAFISGAMSDAEFGQVLARAVFS